VVGQSGRAKKRETAVFSYGTVCRDEGCETFPSSVTTIIVDGSFDDDVQTRLTKVCLVSEVCTYIPYVSAWMLV
jgi:hypothetical protein